MFPALLHQEDLRTLPHPASGKRAETIRVPPKGTRDYACCRNYGKPEWILVGVPPEISDPEDKGPIQLGSSWGGRKN